MPPHRFGNGLTVIVLIVLAILIFYQSLITLILPFRWNIFVLFLEIFLFLFFLARIVWPY